MRQCVGVARWDRRLPDARPHMLTTMRRALQAGPATPVTRPLQHHGQAGVNGVQSFGSILRALHLPASGDRAATVVSSGQPMSASAAGPRRPESRQSRKRARRPRRRSGKTPGVIGLAAADCGDERTYIGEIVAVHPAMAKRQDRNRLTDRSDPFTRVTTGTRSHLRGSEVCALSRTGNFAAPSSNCSKGSIQFAGTSWRGWSDAVEREQRAGATSRAETRRGTEASESTADGAVSRRHELAGDVGEDRVTGVRWQELALIEVSQVCLVVNGALGGVSSVLHSTRVTFLTTSAASVCAAFVASPELDDSDKRSRFAPWAAATSTACHAFAAASEACVAASVCLRSRIRLIGDLLFTTGSRVLGCDYGLIAGQASLLCGYRRPHRRVGCVARQLGGQLEQGLAAFGQFGASLKQLAVPAFQSLQPLLEHEHLFIHQSLLSESCKQTSACRKARTVIGGNPPGKWAYIPNRHTWFAADAIQGSANGGRWPVALVCAQ